MQYVQVAELEIDPAQLESYKAAVKGKSKRQFVKNREFWCYTPWLKTIIRPVLGFSRSIGTRMHTGHIWNPPILRNTR